jgi:cell wall assembly regulator SMI1
VRSPSQFDGVLLARPMAGALHPPASVVELENTARALNIRLPAVIRSLYGLHDGATMEGGDEMGFFVFPHWWQWMPLAAVLDNARFPLAWCQSVGIEGRVGDSVRDVAVVNGPTW